MVWGSMVGEASPYYLYHPEVPARLYGLVPEAKLIVILRNPADRAVSQYFHEKRLGHENLSIAEALEAEDERIDHVSHLPTDAQYKTLAHISHSYKRRGLYMEQLKRYVDLVPRENILVLLSEDLFAEPAAVLTEAFGFLGVDADYQCEGLEPMNVGRRTSKVPAEVYAGLASYFESPNRELAEFLGRDLGW